MLRVLLSFLAISAFGAELPAGTEIQIRLTTAINTATSKVNDPVGAVVIAPVLDHARVAVAAGTTVDGRVQQITQAIKTDDQAIVKITFDKLGSVPLNARVSAVDNARESVDEQGRIVGIVASQTPSARLDQGIAKVSERYPALGEFLGAAKGAVVKEADPNIDYEPGVEMTISLTKPLHWEGEAAAPEVRPISPADELAEMVSDQPMRTMAEKPPLPSDTTNVVLLGSEPQIEDAFREAGWSSAQKLNAQSKLETFRALAEGRGYKEAPVSTLLLDGRPPDLVFQKQNNTFAARHHIRLWRRPGTFNGKEIWVCAATHDIGIDYSDRDHTFIHRVDPEVDRERAKVTNDLLFTGKVQGLALVGRPNAAATGRNATGDEFHTDGRMAVLEF